MYKYTLATHIIIVLTSSALGILSPFIIGSFLDNFIEGANVNDIIRFAAIFGTISLLKILKGYIASILHTKMQLDMGYAFNRDTINHIQSLSLSYINKQDSAYLSQRASMDTGNLVAFCISILQQVITNLVMIIIPFIILLSMNSFVAVLLLLFFLLYTILYFVFKKSLYNAGLVFTEAQSKFFSSCLERLRYIKLVKINSLHNQMNKRTDNSFSLARNATIHKQKLGYLYSGLDGFVSTIAQIALFIVGGMQILAGNFTIGMFTVFTSYFNMILNSGRYFFGLGAYYQQTLVAYDRITEIFTHKPEQHGDKIIDDITKIELCNVSFTYHGKDNTIESNIVIDNLNATFEKGKIYGIAGGNGVGKSTLVSLIMGLYINEYSGTIKYSNIDIRHIDMLAARNNCLAFSEQEPLLFNDTIIYNLTFGEEDEPPLKPSFYKYVDLLSMDEFISGRTLDFTINEKNTNTSGGEKQKISILKALYKSPSVMIFDEPTSALDAKTSKKFISYVKSIKQDKIVIIITHDTTVIDSCDEVLELC